LKSISHLTTCTTHCKATLGIVLRSTIAKEATVKASELYFHHISCPGRVGKKTMWLCSYDILSTTILPLIIRALKAVVDVTRGGAGGKVDDKGDW